MVLPPKEHLEAEGTLERRMEGSKVIQLAEVLLLAVDKKHCPCYLLAGTQQRALAVEA